MKPPRSSVVALSILRLLPEDTWVSTATLTRLASESGLTIALVDGLPHLHTTPLSACLRANRRAGWALYARSTDMWTRTPSGSATLAAAA